MRAPLSLRWTATDAAATIGLPVVKGDHAVVLQGDWDLACFDGSGSRRWRVGGKAYGCAILNDEVAVKVSRGSEHALLLLDLSSGAVRREEPTGGGYLSAVLSRQRGFIERDYPEPRVSRRAFDGGLPALWQRSFGEKGSANVDLRLAADGERCVVAVTPEGGPTRVLALHLDTGHELWSVAVDDFDAPAAEGVWDPTLTHGLVVINTAHGVAALRAEDGRLAWKSETSGAKTVHGDRVFMSGMSRKAPGEPSEIVVLDVLTGREVWRRAYPEVLKKSRANRLTGYLAVSESHIFSGDGAGGVWAFDVLSGDPVWYHRAKGSAAFSPWTLPVIAGGRLYVTSAGDRPQLFCYEEAQRGAASEESAPEPEEARLGFEIERAHTRQKVTRSKPYFEKGGPWTVLRCLLETGGAFYLAFSEKSGEGRLWVDEVDEGEALLEAIRKAFPVRGAKAPPRGTRVAGPVLLDVALLGSGVDESGQKKGSWTMSKWTGEDGVPEFFVNWSLAEKRGAIVEKDESYRKDLTQLVARLVVR